jgi:hypothetical protein
MEENMGRWLMPVIPDTQEAEIGKIKFQGQLRQKVQEPILTNSGHGGLSSQTQIEQK